LLYALTKFTDPAILILEIVENPEKDSEKEREDSATH
jgi:hypothetical protein